MIFLGVEIPALAVLIGSMVGAMAVGIGINITGEIVKSVYKILFKKRFELWLKKFDHHKARVIKILYKR